MDKTLLEVFDEQFSHLKFNAALASSIYRFQVGFVNKNEEHMAFFGGKLLGVHVIRMMDSDFNTFYNEVIDVDQVNLKRIIHNEVKDINPNWKVSSDVFSLTCMYLIHRFLTTPLLSEDKKHRACLDCGLLFHYRWITAIVRDYFRFPADPELAQATYAALSNRYLIKKYSSWQDVFSYRSEEIIDKESIHYETLKRFGTDTNIVYLVEDSQGRVRDMVKNIYAEMIKRQNSGDRISSNSSVTIDTDGVEVIRDKIHGLEAYTNYILSVLPDRNSFIRHELITVVVRLMHTMQERGFVKVLEWMSEEGSQREDVETFVKKILLHSFNYLVEHGNVLKDTKDLPKLLATLKGVYVSSRSSDPDLLELRDLGTKLIAESIGKTNEQTVAAIRTGIFLYVCLRTYTKHYYGG